MRLSDLHLNPLSVVSTIVIAAAAGIATLIWPVSHDASDPSAVSVVLVEEMTVTARAEPSLAVRLHPQRRSYLPGETIVLEATLRNVGNDFEAVSASGVFDLAVQRTSSPRPMRLGDVSFLAVAEVTGSETILLAPGESTTRLVTVGPEPPFDAPGRYRVTGAWVSEDAPADVAAFEVVIDDTEAVAVRTSARPASGA